MEIKEIVSYFLNQETNILEVSFRTIEDDDDVIRTGNINFSVASEYGFSVESEDKILLEDEIDEDELWERNYFTQLNEDELLSFLNEYYEVNPNELPETELYWLYKNCSLVVVTTLYEAGSFPLLEAMSLNVPVICSSVTSLPETIGDSRFIFDPLNIEQMGELITETLNDEKLRIDNIKNSKTRIENLITINTFSYILNLWREVINVNKI